MQQLRMIPKGGNKGGNRPVVEVTGNFTPSVDAPPKALADYWVNRLIQRPIAEDKKQVLLEAIGKSANENSLKQMIQLLLGGRAAWSSAEDTSRLRFLVVDASFFLRAVSTIRSTSTLVVGLTADVSGADLRVVGAVSGGSSL